MVVDAITFAVYGCHYRMVFGLVLCGILLEMIRVVNRNVKKKLFLGKACLKTDALPESIDTERRSHQKVSIQWPVTMEFSGGSVSATARDISLGGAFVACPDPLPLKERFYLSMEMPGEARLLLTAEVVWSNSNVPEERVVTRGMGIKFVDNHETDRHCLRNRIEACLDNHDKKQWLAGMKGIQLPDPLDTLVPQAV